MALVIAHDWHRYPRERYVVVLPVDGSCCADGCSEQAEQTTGIGLRLCAGHFSAFYATDRLPMKDGVCTIR